MTLLAQPIAVGLSSDLSSSEESSTESRRDVDCFAGESRYAVDFLFGELRRDVDGDSVVSPLAVAALRCNRCSKGNACA